MTVSVSVVIPVYNGEATIGMCLNALSSQSLPRSKYEVIVIDDGSTDKTVDVASRYPVRILRQKNQGAPAARNRGIQEADGLWVAFTDADCIPSRTWLEQLLKAVEKNRASGAVLGAAGRVMGYGSESETSRLVDLTGGLDSQRHLTHPKYPFAVFGNVMYCRENLIAVGGADPRFYTYDACDLHTRLLRQCPGAFYFEPRAVVLHHHRPDWAAYRQQQFGYGKGLGQFYWKYRDEIGWSIGREIGAWIALIPLGLAVLRKAKNDEALVRRGCFIKNMAQRQGFIRTYWSPKERKRWLKE